MSNSTGNMAAIMLMWMSTEVVGERPRLPRRDLMAIGQCERLLVIDIDLRAQFSEDIDFETQPRPHCLVRVITHKDIHSNTRFTRIHRDNWSDGIEPSD